MGVFENNLEALKKNNERLYKDITEDTFDWNKEEVAVEEAKNGELILSYLKEDKQVYLSSKYNPNTD